MEIPDITWVRVAEAVALVTGIAGAVLNAKGRVESFYVWSASNLVLFVLMLKAGYWTTTALYGLYLAINAYGVYSWRRQGIATASPDGRATGA